MTSENMAETGHAAMADLELRQMLVDSARRWSEGANGAEARQRASRHVHGCPPDRWRELADLGWLGIDIQEKDGGLGGGLVELCLLAEQMGRSLLVEPFVSNVVLGGGLLKALASGNTRSAWMPELAAGNRRAAWMAWEADGEASLRRPEAHAARSAGGWVVTANKGWMPGAAGADAYLLAARLEDTPDRMGVFLMLANADGLDLQDTRLYDGRHAARLQAANAPAELVYEGNADHLMSAMQQVLDRGLIVHCAETLGSAQAAFDLTLDYLRTRRQFGCALGEKQVLQHRLVDLYVEQQEARALCFAAANAPDARLASALGLRTADVARHSWQETIQLHGAIGMTEEYAAGEYVRRLAMADRLYGTATAHAERLAHLTLGDAQ